jgi:hypothetical protein
LQARRREEKMPKGIPSCVDGSSRLRRFSPLAQAIEVLQQGIEATGSGARAQVDAATNSRPPRAPPPAPSTTIGVRAGSSLSRWRLAMRTSAMASIRSTSTFGDRLPIRPRCVRQHQVLRLAVERDDGDLVGANLHDLEVPRGDCLVRLREEQRLVGRNFSARNLDDLCRQAAAVVEQWICTSGTSWNFSW